MRSRVRRASIDIPRNLRAAYADAIGRAGVAIASPQIALVGGYVLIYGLGLLALGGRLAEHAAVIVFAVALGFLGLVTGIAAAWRPGRRPTAGGPGVAGWDRTLAVASGLVLLGTVAMVLYLLAIGEIPLLMTEAEQGRVDAAERGGAILRVLTLLALPGCWLLVAEAARRRTSRGIVWASAAVLVTLAGQLATANRAPSFQLIAVSIGIVVLASRHERLRPRAVAGLAGIGAALVLAVGLLGALRIASGLPPGTPVRLEQLTEQAVSAYIRVPIQNLSFALEAVPERIGWRLGYTYVQPLLTALPGKQTTFDQDLKTALEQVYPGGGTVPGLLGEAYANFGPPGWFLVPLLLGAWITWLSRTVAAARTPEFRALYAFAIVHAVGGFLGGLHVASPFPAIAYAVLGAAAVMSARPGAQRSTSEGPIVGGQPSPLG